MSQAEIGAYILALLEQWASKDLKAIPDHPRTLRRIARGPFPASVRHKFVSVEINGEAYLRNERLAEEWVSAKAEHAARVNGGKRRRGCSSATSSAAAEHPAQGQLHARGYPPPEPEPEPEEAHTGRVVLPSAETDPIVAALVQACRQDPGLLDDRLAREFAETAEKLKAANADVSLQELAQMILEFGRWHFEVDFPGHRATIARFRDKWGAFLQYRQEPPQACSRSSAAAQVGGKPPDTEEYRRYVEKVNRETDEFFESVSKK